MHRHTLVSTQIERIPIGVKSYEDCSLFLDILKTKNIQHTEARPCFGVGIGGMHGNVGGWSESKPWVGTSGAIPSKYLVLELLAVILNNQCCIPVLRPTVDGVLLCARHCLHLHQAQVQHTAPAAWCLARCSL